LLIMYFIGIDGETVERGMDTVSTLYSGSITMQVGNWIES